MPNPHPISHLKPDSGAIGRAKAQLTRQWYRDTLLAIFRGEIKCTSTQLNALVKFADNRGWYPPTRPKQKAIAAKTNKPKPQLSPDVLNRLGTFYSDAAVSALSAALNTSASSSTDCNATQTQA